MGKIELDFRVLGDVGTNCYLLCNQETKECILIDAPDLPDRIDEMIAASGCKLCAVLLTHGHYDHILAAEEVRKRHNVQVYVSEDEKELLHSPQMNLSQDYGRSTVLDADVYHKDGAHLSLAGLDIEVFHTPGHTLFAASVGRTDFPTGSMSAIVRSIKGKILVLPDDTKVFPGHGESTSVAYEKKYNPFLQ